jgi:2,4-dienoyl-CoA reductase-like NADH-dependent reductase (Old Yellow Enzyme family)
MSALAQPSTKTGRPLLFQSIALRGLTLKNRVMVSPMSMYSAADGFADDFHLVHAGRFALGGAGLVILEAAYAEREARITPGCLGLWDDAHIPPLRRIAEFLHRFGAAAGIQLGHSGWKGAVRRPWHGGEPLNAEDRAARDESAWPIVSPSAIPFDARSAVPHALTANDLNRLIDTFVAAAQRADAAGFDVLELHCAHGYLLHAFLSPLSNRRTDDYGGSLDNRMRFPLRVVEALRRVWPDDKPLFVRISAVDGVGAGWSIEDSVVLVKALRARGVDAVDCSSGGMKLAREQQLLAREPGFQVPFAGRIRREAGVPTVAVGLIRDAAQAQSILAAGDADLVALAREMLFNPNWAAQAAVDLIPEAGWREWPEPFAWWLERRARLDKSRKQV